MLQVTSEDQFFETLASNDIVIVDFWAAWCGPCRNFAPIFEAEAAAQSEVVFAKVDTEANQELSGRLGIQAIPTTMAFKAGALIYNEAGALNKAGFHDLVEQIKAVPIEDIRRQIAEHEGAHADEHAANTAAPSE